MLGVGAGSFSAAIYHFGSNCRKLGDGGYYYNGNIRLENGEEITRHDIGQTGKAPVWGLIKLNFFLPLAAVLALSAATAVLVVLGVMMGKPVGIIFGVTIGIWRSWP